MHNLKKPVNEEIQITYFAFESLSPVVKGIIDNDKKEIKANVPLGTDLTNIKPVIHCTKGATVSLPAGNNFLHPAIINVNGNGRQVNYTVSVREAVAGNQILKVGKNRQFKTIGEAAVVAKDNTVIEIDAGTYKGDVITWTQNNLYIRAVGEVIVDADGQSTGGGVGTWQIIGGKVCIEGVTFINARVPDNNGAGIRLTKGDLTVINCCFKYNECGILTANESSISLTVKNCEFGYNGIHDENEGWMHSIYVGFIGRFVVTGSYFHHTKVGHLVKTRAALNIICYNMIADGNEDNSQSSYEIDIPSGGQAVLVGNIIQKSSTPNNPHVISFAMEHTDRHPKNEIYLSHNTIVNNYQGNSRMLNAPASITKKAYNNLISENTVFDPSNYWTDEKGNILFKKNELTNNYSPVSTVRENWKKLLASNIDKALPADLKALGITLVPVYEYRYPMNVATLTQTPTLPGAIQR